MKQEATVWKKTTANHISEKGLVFRKYDELSRLKIKKAIQLWNGQKTWTDISMKKHFNTDDKKHTKRSSESSIRNMTIRTTMRYQYIPSRMT